MSDENYDPDYHSSDNRQMFYLKWDLGKNIWPRICPECYYCANQPDICFLWVSIAGFL